MAGYVGLDVRLAYRTLASALECCGGIVMERAHEAYEDKLPVIAFEPWGPGHPTTAVMAGPTLEYGAYHIPVAVLLLAAWGAPKGKHHEPICMYYSPNWDIFTVGALVRVQGSAEYRHRHANAYTQEWHHGIINEMLKHLLIACPAWRPHLAALRRLYKEA
jgi:hypothetical protein